MNLSKKRESALDDFILSLARLPYSQPFFPAKSEVLSINWDVFINKVYIEGLSGLLSYNIAHYPNIQFIPQWVKDRLKEDYIYNTGRNIFIEEELKKLFKIFQASELSILIFKGAVFFNRLYPSLGIRPMADVDIAIRKEDHFKAKEILTSCGYKYPKGYPFLFYKDSFYLDLHLDTTGLWRVSTWPGAINIKTKEVWEKTEAIDKNLPLVRTLWVYDSLLACCEHLQRHSFKQLIWFIDISMMIRHKGNSFNWSILFKRAKQFGLEKSLLFVLRYLNMAGFVFIPTKVLSYLDGISLNRFEKRSLTMLLNNRRDNIPGELLFLFATKGIKSKFMLVYQILYMRQEQFPLAVEHVGIWMYLKRACMIIAYIITKMFALLKPAGNKL